MNKRFIEFSGPDILDVDIQSVNDVLKSGWLAHGKYSEKLETLFCEYTGAKFATTVSNCTAGLHLSCLAADFGPGDEVIVPAQTHTATAHAVEYTGAKATFVDIDPLSGNILVEDIEKKVNSNTKGIIPVHLTGYPCEMAEINNLCKKNNLILIEDCAHGIGTNINNIHVGNFGIAGCFSFYPTKQITTGEGGIVISNNKKIIEKIRKLKAFGIDTPPELREKPGVYDVQQLGYNYRMTDFQAALGAGQMERYEKNVATRRLNAKEYCKLFKHRKEVLYTEYSSEHSYFLFQIILKNFVKRDEVLMNLKENGIGISIHYATPVPLMTYYRKKYDYKIKDFPNAVTYGKQSISLPVHSKLKLNDIKYVVEILNNTLDRINK
jgi:dTDP-4-amino-4,6-dideoxygalactose transaminase